MAGLLDKDVMPCNKPRRTPSHPKKSHVVKACYDGTEKLIRLKYLSLIKHQVLVLVVIVKLALVLLVLVM